MGIFGQIFKRINEVVEERREERERLRKIREIQEFAASVDRKLAAEERKYEEEQRRKRRTLEEISSKLNCELEDTGLAVDQELLTQVLSELNNKSLVVNNIKIENMYGNIIVHIHVS